MTGFVEMDPSWHAWVERFGWHLDQLPGLVEAIREARTPLGAAKLDREFVSGGSAEGAPAPVRVDAVDDADELWSAVVEYVAEVAEILGDEAPVAVRSARWESGNCQGLPAALSSRQVRVEAFALVDWLMARSEQVAGLDVLRDSEEHIFALVRKLGARYTVQAPATRRVCLKCGARAVEVVWGKAGAKVDGYAQCGECHVLYVPGA